MTQQQSEPCVANSCEQAGPHERGEVCPTDREERYWQAAYNDALEDAAKEAETMCPGLLPSSNVWCERYPGNRGADRRFTTTCDWHELADRIRQKKVSDD